MNKEQLTELGLDDEQMQAVFKLNGLAIENVKNNYTSEIESYKEKEVELNELKARLSDEPDIDSLKTKLSEYEEQVTKLNESLTKAEEDSINKVNEVKYNFLIENALNERRARDPKLVMGLIDKDSIKLEDDKLTGLDEQLKEVTKTHDYLFKPKEDEKDRVPNFTTGENNPARSKGEKDPFKKAANRFTKGK